MLKLLEIARNAILDKDYINDEFKEKKGIFVTIYVDNELRGCIGFVEPVFSLSEGIIKAARLAAFGDRRFIPLNKNDKFKIEISILTKPKLIKVNKYEDYFKKIKIGDDGLIIENGLLLPKVFVEFDCDVKKALEMVCEKAGLDKDSWKDLKKKLYKFQAEVISE